MSFDDDDDDDGEARASPAAWGGGQDLFCGASIPGYEASDQSEF